MEPSKRMPPPLRSKRAVAKHLADGARIDSQMTGWRRVKTLDPLLMAQAAEQGDLLADELIMETATYMGVGTTSVLHTINPNMMLYGGAMTFGRHDTELGAPLFAADQGRGEGPRLPHPVRKNTLRLRDSRR